MFLQLDITNHARIETWVCFDKEDKDKKQKNMTTFCLLVNFFCFYYKSWPK